MLKTHGVVHEHAALKKKAIEDIKNLPIDPSKSPSPEINNIKIRLENIEKILGLR